MNTNALITPLFLVAVSVHVTPSVAVGIVVVKPTLFVLAANAPNIAVDITPETDDVAIGIVAFVPSEEAITLAPVLLATDKLVVTFVDLAVLASISSNRAGVNKPDTLVVATGIVTLSPSDDVITLAAAEPVIPRFVETFVAFAVLASISANNVFASLSSVTWSFPMYAVFIVVPCHTPLLIVPTSVISKAFMSALD